MADPRIERELLDDLARGRQCRMEDHDGRLSERRDISDRIQRQLREQEEDLAGLRSTLINLARALGTDAFDVVGLDGRPRPNELGLLDAIGKLQATQRDVDAASPAGGEAAFESAVPEEEEETAEPEEVGRRIGQQLGDQLVADLLTAGKKLVEDLRTASQRPGSH
jgi:hypothetical protein